MTYRYFLIAMYFHQVDFKGIEMCQAEERMIQRRVVRALQAACMGTDLAVGAPCGLSGGLVIGEEIEVYVLAELPNGYQVEMWTHDADDAYQVARFDALGDAVWHAIDEAEGQSFSRRS